MTGIQADANPCLVAYLVDNVSQVLEPITEAAALTGRVFKDGAYTFGSIQAMVDGRCDRCQAFLFIDLP